MTESPEVLGEPGWANRYFFLILFSHFPKRMFPSFSLGLGIMGCIYFVTFRGITGQQDGLMH